MKKIFKITSLISASLTLPMVASVIANVSSNNSIKEVAINQIKYINGPSYQDILNQVITDDAIPIFFTNNFTVTLTHELMLGLTVLSQTYQNFNKPIIFCVSQDNFYDANSLEVKTNKYDFSALLEDAKFVNLLEGDNLKNKHGNYILYSNTNNFQSISPTNLPNQPYFSKQGYSDYTYSQNFENEYIDNLLNYFNNNETFDIFVSDLRMYFNGWNNNYDHPISDHSNDSHQSSFYKLLKRANHIYLMSEGSTDWVTFFPSYVQKIDQNQIHYYNDYAQSWNQIFSGDEITDAYRETSILDFLNYQEKVTSIDASNGNWITSSSARAMLDHLPDNFEVVIPTLFSYLYFEYFQNDNNNLEVVELIEKFFKLESDNLADYLDNPTNSDNYQPDLINFANRPTLIFLTGKEWSFDNSLSIHQDSINAAKQEMQDLMNYFLKKYPISQFNYVFKFHPNLNKTALAKNIGLVLGNEVANKTYVLSSNYAFELVLAKDFYIAQKNNLKGNLFDYNGNFSSDLDFSFKATFAGYDVRTTTISSTISAINEYLQTQHLDNLVGLTKNLCSGRMNFVPSTFYIDGSGYVSSSWIFGTNGNKKHPDGIASKNREIIINYMQHIYNTGLTFGIDDFKDLSSITKKTAAAYFQSGSNQLGLQWSLIMIAILSIIFATIVYFVLYYSYSRKQ